LGDRTFSSLGGKKLGYWGSTTNGEGTRIIPFSKNNLLNKKANLSGYPGDKTLTQWWDADKIVNVNPKFGPELIYYTIDTCGGQSGAPVWLTNTAKGLRFMIAIHTGTCLPASGSNDCQPIPGAPCLPNRQRFSSNRGVLLTASIINLFRGWMRSM
jgi:V8-like Glu-specific endopeptidase